MVVRAASIDAIFKNVCDAIIGSAVRNVTTNQMEQLMKFIIALLLYMSCAYVYGECTGTGIINVKIINNSQKVLNIQINDEQTHNSVGGWGGNFKRDALPVVNLLYDEFFGFCQPSIKIGVTVPVNINITQDEKKYSNKYTVMIDCKNGYSSDQWCAGPSVRITSGNNKDMPKLISNIGGDGTVELIFGPAEPG